MGFRSLGLLVYVRAGLENGENSRLSYCILVAQLVVTLPLLWPLIIIQ